jgi:hypothetical protein
MDKPTLQTSQPLSALELAISGKLKSEQMPEFSGYLQEKIIRRIDYEREIKALKPKLWAAFGVMAFSVGLLAIAGDYMFKAFAQSPSYHFLALTFTDFGVMADNWQDYTFSILESLPLGALALTLGAGLASVLLTDFSIHQWSHFRKISIAYRH